MSQTYYPTHQTVHTNACKTYHTVCTTFLPQNEPTRFETCRRHQKLNINLENCVSCWFVLYNQNSCYVFCFVLLSQGGVPPVPSNSEDDDANYRDIPFSQDPALQQVVCIAFLLAQLKSCCINLLIGLSVFGLLCLFIYLFVCLFVCLCTHSFIHSFIQ